jgi:hypothetical protein
MGYSKFYNCGMLFGMTVNRIGSSYINHLLFAPMHGKQAAIAKVGLVALSVLAGVMSYMLYRFRSSNLDFSNKVSKLSEELSESSINVSKLSEKLSESSNKVSELSKELSESSNKVSELSEELSQLSKKIIPIPEIYHAHSIARLPVRYAEHVVMTMDPQQASKFEEILKNLDLNQTFFTDTELHKAPYVLWFKNDRPILMFIRVILLAGLDYKKCTNIWVFPDPHPSYLSQLSGSKVKPIRGEKGKEDDFLEQLQISLQQSIVDPKMPPHKHKVSIQYVPMELEQPQRSLQ